MAERSTVGERELGLGLAAGQSARERQIARPRDVTCIARCTLSIGGREPLPPRKNLHTKAHCVTKVWETSTVMGGVFVL